MLLAMAACGGDTDTDSGGAIEVVTQTNGTNIDPDGYRVVVDEASQAMSIGVDDTVLFQGQTSGSHFVALLDNSENSIHINAGSEFILRQIFDGFGQRAHLLTPTCSLFTEIVPRYTETLLQLRSVLAFADTALRDGEVPLAR
jgi:hypothetical protein